MICDFSADLSDVVAQTLLAFGVLRRVPEDCLVKTMEQVSDVAHGFLAEENEGCPIRIRPTVSGRRTSADIG